MPARGSKHKRLVQNLLQNYLPNFVANVSKEARVLNPQAQELDSVSNGYSASVVNPPACDTVSMATTPNMYVDRRQRVKSELWGTLIKFFINQ